MIIHRARRAAPSEQWWSKCIASTCIGENACFAFGVQTTDCSDKTWLILVTRRIKASQLLQSIVCAFRSIAGAATAEKLVLSH